MQRFSASLGVGAMLLALVYGPMFHVHEQGDHDTAALTVHAHLPGIEHALANVDHPEMESPHSHAHVRWVDILTLSKPVTIAFHVVVDRSEPLVVPSQVMNRIVAPVQSLHLHSPPVPSDRA